MGVLCLIANRRFLGRAKDPGCLAPEIALGMPPGHRVDDPAAAENEKRSEHRIEDNTVPKRPDFKPHAKLEVIEACSLI